MSLKVVDYFDHEADIGIIGRGSTIEAAFIHAAEAVFGIMTDLSNIPPATKIPIEFKEDDLELALVVWINALISKARENNLVFSKFDLTRKSSKWMGYAYGTQWQDDTVRGTEVKGATLTELKVKKNKIWEARCVVDV